MPRNSANRRVQDVTAAELRSMSEKLKKAGRKLEALAVALEVNERDHLTADGKKMADDGIRRIAIFIGNCEKTDL
jgi:23S rRNA pseudoU1915 N3-methylase RlmH